MLRRIYFDQVNVDKSILKVEKNFKYPLHCYYCFYIFLKSHVFYRALKIEAYSYKFWRVHIDSHLVPLLEVSCMFSGFIPKLSAICSSISIYSLKHLFWFTGCSMFSHYFNITWNLEEKLVHLKSFMYKLYNNM